MPQVFPKISLLINIVVLVPVCVGLLRDDKWVTEAYGGRTQARGILLSIYAAILFLSVLLLVTGDARMAFTLLLMQVIYKVTTPLTTGSFRNPVVISNLLIAAFHSITLYTIFRSEQ